MLTFGAPTIGTFRGRPRGRFTTSAPPDNVAAFAAFEARALWLGLLTRFSPIVRSQRANTMVQRSRLRFVANCNERREQKFVSRTLEPDPCLYGIRHARRRPPHTPHVGRYSRLSSPSSSHRSSAIAIHDSLFGTNPPNIRNRCFITHVSFQHRGSDAGTSGGVPSSRWRREQR